MTLIELAAMCEAIGENSHLRLLLAERQALREASKTLLGYADLERRKRVGARDVGADHPENGVGFSQFRGTDVER